MGQYLPLKFWRVHPSKSQCHGTSRKNGITINPRTVTGLEEMRVSLKTMTTLYPMCSGADPCSAKRFVRREGSNVAAVMVISRALDSRGHLDHDLYTLSSDRCTDPLFPVLRPPCSNGDPVPRRLRDVLFLRGLWCSLQRVYTLTAMGRLKIVSMPRGAVFVIRPLVLRPLVMCETVTFFSSTVISAGCSNLAQRNDRIVNENT